MNKDIRYQLKGFESEIIAKIKQAFPFYYESLSGNDCSLYTKSDPDSHTLITKDLLVEGNHFYNTISMDALAYKSLLVNMSDILSDGGFPKAFILGLGVGNYDRTQILELTDRFCYWAKHFGVPIIGGDTVSSPQLFISVTCLGESRSTPWYRNRAQVGDYLYLTGKLGDSSQGFKKAQQAQGHIYDVKDPLVKRHLYPPFRLKEVAFLNRYYKDHIHAGTDISDGFIPDLYNILLESKVGAKIFLDQIEGIIKLEENHLLEILSSAEEYEILFTSDRLIDSSTQSELSLHCIGKITQNALNIEWLYQNQTIPLDNTVFSHLFKHFQ